MDEHERARAALISGGVLRFEAAGTGPVVVLVHGNFVDARMWDPQFNDFAEVFTAVRYDLRGFGASPAVDVPYSHHGDLRQLLAHLGHDRAHLVGLSLGAHVVLDAAVAFPNLAASLVVVPGWPLKPEPWMERGWQTISAAVHKHDLVAARKAIMHFPPMRSLDRRPDLRRRVAEMIDAYPWSNFERDEEYAELEPPAMERLSAIRCKTLVLSGALDDPAFQETGSFIAAHLPGAERRVIPDAGHMVNMEQPEAFNRIVHSFIADAEWSLPAAGAAPMSL